MRNTKKSQKFTVQQAIYRMWTMMNEHKATFLIANALHASGISSAVNAGLYRLTDRKLRKHPSDAMLKSEEYYRANRPRMDALLSVFADEKSKLVWGGN